MFERIEDKDLYMEDESILPIVVRYNNHDVEWHNMHKDIPFDNCVKLMEGVHDFIVINRGVNERTEKEEFELSIDGVDCSVRLRMDIDNHHFFSPRFSPVKVFAPEEENEFLEIKANLVFTQDTRIGFWQSSNLIDRMSEISEFLEKCRSLSVPFDDSSLGENNKKAWQIYAEGMSRLNREKQTLLPIKKVGRPHKKKNRYGELITVIDIELNLPSRQDLFKQSLYKILSPKVESNFTIEFPTENVCSVVFNSYHQFGEEFEEELNNLAEEHCFNLDGSINYHIKGKVSLKQDNDFDEILQQLEDRVCEYSEDFRRIGTHFLCYSDDTGNYLERLIQQSYSEFLSIGERKSLIATFQNTDDDYTEIKNRLIESGIPENNIRVYNETIQIRSMGKPLDIKTSVFNDLKFEKCTVKYTLRNNAFDSSLQIEDLETVSIPNKGGYYEGIVLSPERLRNSSLKWQKVLKETFGANFKGQIFNYSFRKKLNIDPLKTLQRDVFFENDSIRISAMRGIATLTPASSEEYKELIQRIKDNLPDGIRISAPRYSIEREIKLVYEEEEACKRMFNKIRNGITSLDNIINLEYDGVDYTTRLFEFTFKNPEERNNKIEAIYSAFESFKRVCSVNLESLDGYTHICFARNMKLEDEYQNGFKTFNNEVIKVVDHKQYTKAQATSKLENIQSRIDGFQQQIDSISFSMPRYVSGAGNRYNDMIRSQRRRSGESKKELIELKKASIAEKYELQREANSRVRELLYDAPTIGECFSRTYDQITVKLPEGFDQKAYEEKPILKIGKDIYFPMAGSSSEAGRQKYALDRIEGKKYTKDNPPVNDKLANFLFNPRYARPAKEEDISLAAQWVREHGISKNPLNDMQIEAVAKACSADDIAFIQGPPGTGKTTVIAEIIWKEIHNDPNCKILLTSQNNLAVDNALERLHEARGLRPVRIFNTFDNEDAETKDGYQYMVDVILEWKEKPTDSNSNNAAAHWMENVKKSATANEDYPKYSKAIHSWIECLDSKTKYARDIFADNYKANVNLFAATCSYCASKDFTKTYKMLYSNERIAFDVIIMDEASKATLPEMAVPMVNGMKIILIGDHRQLPPILSGEHKKAFEIMDSKDLFEESYETLKTSHFGVMFKAAQRYVPSIVSTLTIQYRMHEQIMNTINQFYKRDVVDGLICGIKETMDLPDYNHPGSRYHGLSFDRILTPDDHAIWIDVRTAEMNLNPGFKNLGEVDAVEFVINMLMKSTGYKEYLAAQKKDEDKEIGVITFYSGQRKAIVNRKLPDSNTYRISAVDRFQGMERNIVIVSTVRSNSTKNIGFARESERINVAFSRAKKLLIVVGNKQLFSQFDDYKEAISNMKTIDYRTLKDLLKQ